MTNLEKTLSIACSDDRNIAIASLISLDAPGGYAIREPDGRIMVWASEDDSVDDNGARAIFRSNSPESDQAWRAVASRTFVADAVEV